MNGLVTKSTGSWYTVLDLDGGGRMECRLRGQFRIRGIKDTNPVVVGDRVTYEPEKDGTGSSAVFGRSACTNEKISSAAPLPQRM